MKKKIQIFIPIVLMFSVLFLGFVKNSDDAKRESNLYKTNPTVWEIDQNLSAPFINQTDNSGTTIGWFSTPTGQSVGFDGLFVLNETTAWASGDIGRIIKTTDGGVTWVQQTPPTTNYVYSINFVDENTGYAGASGAAPPSQLLKTTNGGTTWTSVDNNSLTFAHAIHFINAQSGFIGGNGGFVRTTDGGATWNFVVQASAVYQFDFANENTGWFVGDLGTIQKTTDGGNTWTPQVSGTSAPLHDVFVVNDQVAWAVGNNATARKTTNGGTTWTTVTLPISAALWAWGVSFVDENTGWITGDAGWVMKTTNGGTSWVRQPVPSIVQTGALYQIKAASPNVIYSAGDAGRVIKTENGGDAPAMSVSAVNLGFGNVMVGNDSTRVLRVINTGTMALTVDSLNFSNPVFSANLSAPFTINAGDTTSVNITFAPTDSIQYNATLRVVGNDPFTPVRTVNLSGLGMGTVSISQVGTEIPSAFSLSQNYPNPFNPSTSINFAIPVQGMVSLKVYDLLGKEVATLVNGVKTPGMYVADFDASKLTSGIYFYKLEANGFVDVKRMVLLK